MAPRVILACSICGRTFESRRSFRFHRLNHDRKGKTYEESFGEAKAKELKAGKVLVWEGRKHTEATKQKMRVSAKKSWVGADARKAILSGLRKGRPLEEVFGKDIADHIKQCAAKSHTGRKHTAAWKKQCSLFSTGRRHTDATKQKLSLLFKGRAIPQTVRDKLSESVKRYFLTHDNPMKGRHHTDEAKRKMSEGHKENWRDEKFAQKMFELFDKAPNKGELFLLQLLGRLFPGDFSYCGDGKIWIAGKNPDFINVNGRKQIIELFGEYWHKPKDAKVRARHFAKYGYKTLVVWYKELQNVESLELKLQGFVEGNK